MKFYVQLCVSNSIFSGQFVLLKLAVKKYLEKKRPPGNKYKKEPNSLRNVN